MHRLRHITALFLAFSFLLSSLGFTINRMVCLESGKVKLSLTQMEDCCPAEKTAGHTFSHSCCDITNTYFDLSDFSVSPKLNGEQPLALHTLYLNDCFTSGQLSFRIPGSASSGQPPSLHGRQLLSFISVLII